MSERYNGERGGTELELVLWGELLKVGGKDRSGRSQCEMYDNQGNARSRI